MAKKVPPKIKKAVGAEARALASGKGHAAAERLEKRMLPKGKK